MGYIAKGTITLNTVNDAYTVSLSKSSCVIKADFDGTNPKLSDAQTVITVCRGDKSMAFNCTLAEEFSSYASVTSSDERQKYVLKINNLPSDELEGSISATITTDDGFTTDIQFGYSIVRESTMLDWIKDWEGGKTKIGNTYVMTPKIFIGKKAEYAEYSTNGTNAKEDIMAVPGLTGVYIGPDSDSTGIYGYKNSVEIFHLNNEGGSIGGWNIGQSNIYSKNGQMYISSAGSIYAQDSNGKHIWELNEDGSAKFACGNVVFDADGNAQFTGKITSSSGSIAGWSITSNQIHSGNLVLDKKAQTIGIVRSGVYTSTDQNGNQETESLKSITRAGGVGFYYSSDTDWGLIGCVANTAWQTTDASISFKLGSSNSIAGWGFDGDALWSGTKNNTANSFTTTGITIGSTGLRSTKWRFEKDGSGALAENNIVWDSKGNITLSSAVKFTLGDNSTATIQAIKGALETTIADGDKDCISKITQTANSISSTVSANKTELDGKIKANTNSISTLTQTANSISAKVSTMEKGLADTGIDITNKKVIVTASNFAVRNNSGTTTMTVDKDGNLCTSGNASIKGTVYASSGEFTGKVTATSGSIKNMEAENITCKSFTLESGKIACFDFTSSYIGVASSSSVANTLHLSKDVLIFNGTETGHQVVIGPDSGLMGMQVLGRLTDTRDNYMGKVGLAINVDGHSSLLFNDAIQIDGGCISGFKLRTKFMTSGGTIDKLTNVVWITASNCTVYLPDLGQEIKYDGHVIMIRTKDASVSVKSSGSNGIYYSNTTYSNTLPGDTIIADPCTLVFFAGVSVNNGQYKGLWVMI